MTRFRYLGLLLLPVAAALAAGCGSNSNTAQIRGAIVQKGAPLKIGDAETLSIEIVYKDKDGNIKQTYGQFNEDDGTFAFDAGIPVGTTVKFLVRCDGSSSGAKDRFKNAFATERSPLAYAVTAGGSREVTLDLTAKRVKES